MSSMMNPLVRARFGNYTKGEAVQSTPPVRGNSKNNAGRNADFTTLPNNQNTLWVPRQPNDQGLCVIECWNKAKGPERCIGQCVVDVQDYIGLLQDGDVPAAGDNAEGGAEGGGVANGGAASPGRPLEHDLILLDQLPDFEALATRSPDRGGISERSQAGILNVKIKWSPPDMEAAKEEGHLVVQVVAVKELRDISDHHVHDYSTFRDSEIVWVVLTALLVYILIGTICFASFFAACDPGAKICCDSTVVEVTGVVNGSARAGIPSPPCSLDDDCIAGCVIATELISGEAPGQSAGVHILDALVFQFTSFTTVGYGTHPRNFTSSSVQLLMILYIVIGMGLMGVLAAAVGESLLALAENVSNEVNMLIEETAGTGLTATTGTLGLFAKGLAKGAQVATNVVSGEAQQAAEKVEQVEDDGMTRRHVEDKKQLLAPVQEILVPYKQLIVSLLGMLGIVLVGAFASMGFDDLDFFTALYMSLVTVTTVGFGDYYPVSVGARIFSIFYIPIGVVFFANALNNVSAIPMKARAAKLESYVLGQFGKQLTIFDLNDLKRSVDLGPSDAMSKNDFALAMLLRLGKLDQDDLERIENVFFELDTDHSGKLDHDDMMDLVELASKHNAQRQAQIEAAKLVGGVNSAGGAIFEVEDQFDNPLNRNGTEINT